LQKLTLIQGFKMNILDKAINYISPEKAARRAAYRSAAASYEASESNRLRNFRKSSGGQNINVQRSAYDLRVQARHAVLNHDLARGVLETMVNNVVGNGVGIEPQPKDTSGNVHEQYANDLREAWKDWTASPDVTGRHKWSQVQRLLAWSRYRDGEVFGQMVFGDKAGLVHGTRVPFSIEMIDADSVPLGLNNTTDKIIQGIRVNGWGRPQALHVIKQSPWQTTLNTMSVDTVPVPWARVLHYAGLESIGQMRGVTKFASILNRLEDVKDYEESERVAAKIAAKLTAYIRKGSTDDYSASETDRQIDFEAGMVIDDLGPGEDIGMIDSKRPNPNLITFRAGQLKAVAAGFGTSYSSISKSYDGTYSAQRQELVEQWVNYAIETDNFVCAIVNPTWSNFVRVANLSGVVPMPRDIDPLTVNDALFVGQQMPWIDPLKEAMGNKALVDAGFASEIEVIRKRGQNPYDVITQLSSYQKKLADNGLAKVDGTVGLVDALLNTD